MRQREVLDQSNTRWTCVQAYAGLEEKGSGKAAELSATENGEVPVICTPTGGAQSVRLLLKENWEELPDEELCSATVAASENQ